MLSDEKKRWPINLFHKKTKAVPLHATQALGGEEV
jgi:hypothetical protein